MGTNPKCLLSSPHQLKHKGVLNIYEDLIFCLQASTASAGEFSPGAEHGSIYSGPEPEGQDKMQVYKGLNIATNKVTEEECRGVPHHLLGIVDPDADFAAVDFVNHALIAVDSITRRGRLPIIAGGSNSYIKALVNDDMEFKSKYECCFLWVDVWMPVLHSFVSKRVDQMVVASLIDEAREFFDPEGNYTRGIKRAIGVPELDEFFRNESILDNDTRSRLLEDAIDKIKANTCKLACHQLQNILRLRNESKWHINYLNATEAFLKRGSESVEAWERLVARPATRIVGRFLCEDDMDFMSAIAVPPPIYKIIEMPQGIRSSNIITYFNHCV
ncbi:unnamed protein product [Fraxinus pennsylvanica]|uniref:adenylate dimethylallyltransferase (ADP/ATP-dependent) n=1 Tax=Fraxinus pennsylvanica TaxID=56036 RepID=A0AAD1ZZJ9_9LAMI|nr:unnamed protein product [Fraxinus pennsylvanica]